MKEQIKKLKPLDSVGYESIDLDRLVIYTVVELEKLGIELSLENIIVGAFQLFPRRFSLIGYPEFPDSTRVEKSLWRCKGKKKQWIGGKTPHGYLITDRTRAIVKQTEAQLSNPLSTKQRTSSKMRRKEAILKEVMSAPAYIKYMRGNGESISEAEFCHLLQGTLDSSKHILRENLSVLTKFAEELESEDVLKFLDWLEQRFEDYTNNK